MRFLSLFSGIEAASAAWLPLGWEPAAFSEIDPYCCALLAHYWPDVPNLGDVQRITESQIRALGPIDVVVMGWPCQDVSIAGRRKGLRDCDGRATRSGLFFDAARIVRWARPRWVVGENVPGLLGDRHNAFGDVLAELVGAAASLVPARGQRWTGAGMAIGPERAAAWRVLDAQYFGLAQRRRRVFVVTGCPGDGANPAAVLFEPESSGRCPAPRRETGQEVAGTLGSRTAGGGRTTDLDGHGAYVPLLSYPLKAGGNDRRDESHETYIAGALTARYGKGTDSDASDALVFQCQGTNVGPMGALRRGNGHVTGGVPFVYDDPRRFDDRHRGGDHGDLHPPCNAAVPPQTIIVFDWQAAGAGADTSFRGGSRKYIVRKGEYAGALSASRQDAVNVGAMVRRLTPRECERLMGLPDDFTLVPYRGRPASDSQRYAAIGNSIAVPVLRWIGERIQLMERGEA